jgi:hypothetical protein
MPAHAVKYVECRRNITDMWSRNVRRKIGKSPEMWSHQGSSNSGIMEFRMEFVIRMLKVVRLLMLRISQTCHMPWNIYATTWHTHRHVYTETSNHFEFMTTKNITQLLTQKAQLLPLSYIFPWLNLCRLTSHSSFTRSFLFFPSFILSSQLFPHYLPIFFFTSFIIRSCIYSFRTFFFLSGSVIFSSNYLVIS